MVTDSQVSPKNDRILIRIPVKPNLHKKLMECELKAQEKRPKTRKNII